MADRKDYPINNNLWALMTTAPRDGRPVDLWAKTWLAATDSFIYDRFPRCVWDDGDTMCNVKAGWTNLPKEWYPVAWYRVPHPAVRP